MNNKMLKYRTVCAVLCYGLFTLLCYKVSAQVCTGSLGIPVKKIDFGRGTALYGPPLAAGITNYTYIASQQPGDGSYTIVKELGQGAWYKTKNHDMANDSDGYFMMINASYDPGVFYTFDVQEELCPNSQYQFSAYVSNLLTYKGGIKPKLVFTILDENNHILKTFNKVIPEDSVSTWREYGDSFITSGHGKIKLQIRNDAPGGDGNDLAIDDITFRACGPVIMTSIDGENAIEKTICVGSGANLSADVMGPDIMQYRWERKTGDTWEPLVGETTKNVYLNASALPSGDHKFRLITAAAANFNNPFCRTLSPEFTIHTKPLPAIAVEAEQKVCSGSQIQLNVTGGEGTYAWKGPNGFTSTERSPMIKNADSGMSGNYTVTVRSADCSSDAVIHVSVLEKPIAKIEPVDSPICEGSSTMLSASGGTSYQWSPAAGLSATNIANPVASPVQNTVYTVTVSNNICNDQASVNVNLFKKISVNAGGDRSMIAGEPILLKAQVTGDDFEFSWSPADYLDNPNKLTPLANPPKSITYTLNAVSKNGCLPGISSAFIKVYEKLVIPNTFSPNGDGINDSWVINALATYPESVLSVYNRYGEKVFSTTGGLENWNGKYHGKDVPVGAYYYILNLHNGQQVLSGSITVLR